MTKGIDFTNCPRVFDRAYNGANGKKIAVEYDGRPYMLKFPPSGEGKPTELSYTNSCVSEHIASSIFNMLDVKAQETMLGTFTVNGREKIVCACLDFTGDGKKLYYYDFLSDAKYEDCNQAVRHIYERTDMDKISAFIDGVPYISDLQKEFYKRYIEARLDVLLRPVFEMTELTETEQTGPTISL